MYNVPEDMNMRIEKIAVSVLSCALLAALTGTSLPFAGKVSSDCREHLTPAVLEDVSENAMSGGSGAATRDVCFSEEDLISSEKRALEANNGDDLVAASLDGSDLASSITRKKKTTKTKTTKTAEDQDP